MELRRAVAVDLRFGDARGAAIAGLVERIGHVPVLQKSSGPTWKKIGRASRRIRARIGPSLERGRPRADQHDRRHARIEIGGLDRDRRGGADADHDVTRRVDRRLERERAERLTHIAGDARVQEILATLPGVGERTRGRHRSPDPRTSSSRAA